MARTKIASVPEAGSEAPDFNLPSAQGGQFRLSMRTATGPVVVAFYGPSEEDVAYFKELAAKEDEINLAGGSVVGIGCGEPGAARDFVRETGLKSYVLYDYAGIATREYSLLEKDKKQGEYARPATFVVGADHKVVHSWVGERPKAQEVLEKVSGITGLPKPAEEAGEGEAATEKPKRAKATGKADGKASDEMTGKGEAAGEGEAGGATGERKRLSPEEREKRRAERRAARAEESGEADGKPEGPEGGPDDGRAKEE